MESSSRAATAPTVEHLSATSAWIPDGLATTRRRLSEVADRLVARLPKPHWSWPGTGSATEVQFTGRLASAQSPTDVREALAAAARRLVPGVGTRYSDESDLQGPAGTLAIPLRFAGRTVGSLRLEANRPRPWKAQITRRLARLATLAAAAELAMLASHASPADRTIRSQDPDRDSATGLPGPAFFERYLPTALAMAGRRREPLSLLIVVPEEIDEVREEDGPEFAAAALRIVARAVTQSLRATDVVALLEGDRIAAALPGATRRDLPRVCNLLRRAIAEAGIASAAPLDLDITFLAATYPDEAEDAVELLRAVKPLELTPREPPADLT